MYILIEGGVHIPFCQIIPSTSLDFIWNYFTTKTGVTEGETPSVLRVDREKVEKLERVCSNKGVSTTQKQIRIVSESRDSNTIKIIETISGLPNGISWWIFDIQKSQFCADSQI